MAAVAALAVTCASALGLLVFAAPPDAESVTAPAAEPMTTAARQSGVRRTDLQRHDLSVSGREVVQVRVDLAPGVAFGNHWHHGEEIVYVIEGSLQYAVAGKPPVTLNAGDVLFIPARAVHSAKNVGRVNGAELATYIVARGKPLVVMVP
jgi:quercetin dioxygenase-like cupin family protein